MKLNNKFSKKKRKIFQHNKGNKKKKSQNKLSKKNQKDLNTFNN